MFLYLFLAAAVASSEEVTSFCAHPDASTSSAVNSLPGLRSLGEGRLEGCPRALEETKTLSSESNDTPATVSVASKQTSIIITNAIEPSMLAYKHWTGTYNPDKFTITVNDVEVAQGAQHTLSATADPVNIRFDYSFVNGKRTGAHVISYELNENITQANITFSWNDEWKVMVDNGKPVKHEEIKI
jgi:hypothetical protein